MLLLVRAWYCDEYQALISPPRSRYCGQEIDLQAFFSITSTLVVGHKIDFQEFFLCSIYSWSIFFAIHLEKEEFWKTSIYGTLSVFLSILICASVQFVVFVLRVSIYWASCIDHDVGVSWNCCLLWWLNFHLLLPPIDDTKLERRGKSLAPFSGASRRSFHTWVVA
jgi:hypothetical protein